MDAQNPLTVLDAEIQSFAATLHRCFRDSSWDVVNYYAANAWHASDRAGARWPEVKSRVRTAWEAGIAARLPKAHRVLVGEISPL